MIFAPPPPISWKNFPYSHIPEKKTFFPGWKKWGISFPTLYPLPKTQKRRPNPWPLAEGCGEGGGWLKPAKRLFPTSFYPPPPLPHNPFPIAKKSRKKKKLSLWVNWNELKYWLLPKMNEEVFKSVFQIYRMYFVFFEDFLCLPFSPFFPPAHFTLPFCIVSRKREEQKRKELFPL